MVTFMHFLVPAADKLPALRVRLARRDCCITERSGWHLVRGAHLHRCISFRRTAGVRISLVGVVLVAFVLLGAANLALFALVIAVAS